jgi:hypothetical protein
MELLCILKERGEDIHRLPRQVISKQDALSTKLHWIKLPPPGRLAISARPRGGDWLESELFAWRALGIDTVVSLLEPAEQTELELANERDTAQIYKLRFVSFPIPDRGIPFYNTRPIEFLADLKRELESGRSIAIHCRQGVGRAGMIAASLLTLKGYEPDVAIRMVSDARGVPVPETESQREWIQSLAVPHRG